MFESKKVEGIGQFQSARMDAFWTNLFQQLRGKSVQLLNYDDVRQRLHLRNEHYMGLQEVPLERIVGSVGRYDDFTADFLPKRANMVQRWSRVYALADTEGLPPIELYKVDDVYFVKDGNHRVSVARKMGTPTIEAYVTEIPTTVDLEPGMKDYDWDVATAHANFLQECGLEFSRPSHDPLRLSEAHRYYDLREHIEILREVVRHVRGEELSFKEAAARWYDRVYQPVVELIRKYEIMQHFPERTESDLYIWIVERMRHLVDRYGADLEGKLRPGETLRDYLIANNIPVPEDLYHEPDDPLI